MLNKHNYRRLVFCRTLLLLVAVLVLGGMNLQAANLSDWKTFASTNAVRDISMVDGEIWAATGGGLVIINPQDLSTSVVTNADGLLSNDLTRILVDDNSDVWLASRGWLVKRPASVSQSTQQFVTFPFLDMNNDLIQLNALADDGSQLWIGAGFGLALFSKTIDGGQIQDSYQRFGSFSDGSAVEDVVVTTDSIWVATRDGFAVADRRDPIQLKSFANWTTFSGQNLLGLTNVTPTALASYSGSVILGTSSGAFVLSYSAIDTSMIALALPAATYVYRLVVDTVSNAPAQELHIFTNRGEFLYDGLTVTLLSNAGLPNARIVTGINTSGKRIVGLQDDGLYSTTGSGFTELATQTIPGSDVRDVTVSPLGEVIVALERDGFARLRNGVWLPESLGVINNAVSVAADSSGALWLGTFGSGAWRVTSSAATKYDSLNYSLKGNTDGGNNNFVVIPDMASDARYTYLANFRAFDLNPVSIVDQLDPSRWISIGNAEGINDELITSVDASQDLLVVASENLGVYFVQTGPDPFNLIDYRVTHYFEGASSFRFRLPSDNVNKVRIDSQGDTWVAHRFGLARFDAGFERFVPVTLPLELGPEVKDIAFDPLDNVWIATSTGLGRFDRATNSFELFTQLNSGLVSDEIRALEFDARHNYLWIATAAGLSRLRADLGQANFEIATVTAFPNPFVITFGTERLRFNFSGVVETRIFTEIGELIWVGQSNAGWDGRNQSGAPVSSGVYLFVLSDENGESGIGKVLLIRNQ